LGRPRRFPGGEGREIKKNKRKGRGPGGPGHAWADVAMQAHARTIGRLPPRDITQRRRRGVGWKRRRGRGQVLPAAGGDGEGWAEWSGDGWSRGASGGVLPCSSDLPRRVLLRSISRAELGGGGLRRGGGGRGCLGRAPRGVSCSFRGGSRSFSRPCHVRLLLRRTPRIDYGGVKSGNLESVRGCVRARTKHRAEGNREGVMRESGASSSCSPP
jgi:hypothetical protein